MPQVLKTNIDVQLLSEDTNTVIRFFNDVTSIEPSDYRYGRKTIASGETNVLLSDDFHYVFFKSEQPIEYKIGDGGMSRKATSFFHCGDAIDVYISNETTESIELEFVCAKKV